jgi:hypothetical protein
MIDRRDLDQLKTLGAGQPAPDEIARSTIMRFATSARRPCGADGVKA